MLNYRTTYYTKEVLLNSNPPFSPTGNGVPLANSIAVSAELNALPSPYYDYLIKCFCFSLHVDGFGYKKHFFKIFFSVEIR